MRLTALVLTHDEERHIGRCLESLSDVADRIVVVDSGSTDSTVTIARERGAEVLEHEFVNHAKQVNWALSELPPDTEWVIRVDADEILTTELADEIRLTLPSLPDDVTGVMVRRRVVFLGRMLRYGGLGRNYVLRVFRHGYARCESRWMDEHMIVTGDTIVLKGELVDDNLNSLTWWTTKHNTYASREAADLLNLKYRFMAHDSVAAFRGRGRAGTKRWVKEVVYRRLPLGVRAGLFFLFRYFLQLGFLDGREGAVFQVLQGFWYRYLVDAKMTETENYMRTKAVDVSMAVEEVLGIRVE